MNEEKPLGVLTDFEKLKVIKIPFEWDSEIIERTEQAVLEKVEKIIDEKMNKFKGLEAEEFYGADFIYYLIEIKQKLRGQK